MCIRDSSLSVPLIQYKATLESVEQVGSVSVSSGSRAVETVVISLASSNADSSSSLGMVCFPTGDTLVFEATNLTEVSDPASILR